MSGHCSSMSGPVTSQIGTVLWAQFPYNFSTWEDSGTVSNTLSTLIYELLSIWGFCIKNIYCDYSGSQKAARFGTEGFDGRSSLGLEKRTVKAQLRLNTHTQKKVISKTSRTNNNMYQFPSRTGFVDSR